MELNSKKLKKMIKKYLAGDLDLCQEEFKILCLSYEKVISLPLQIHHLQPPPVVPIERIPKTTVQVPKSPGEFNFTLVIKELNIYLTPSDDHCIRPSVILKN